MHRHVATSFAAVFALGFASASASAQESPPKSATPVAPPSAPSPSLSPVEIPGLGGARTLSLREAMDRFRRQNLELAAARYDVSAARADAIGAGLYTNPTLSAAGAFVAHGVPSGGQQELYFSVTQTAPIAGQVGLRRDAAQRLASSSELEFAASAWQLTCDVRVAYLNLQLAQSRYRLSVTAARDLARVQAIIAERVAAGANPAYDRVRVGVEQSALLAQQTEAEAELYAARVALAQSIGKDVEAMGLLAEDSTEEPRDLPPDARALVAAALTRRAEIAAARTRVSASELRTASAKRAVVPSPDISLGYAHFFRIPGDPSPRDGGAITAGLSVPLPLFDRGQGTIGRSEAEAEAQRLRARQVEVLITREVEVAFATSTARLAAWRRFRDTVAADVERMRQMAEVAYREGRATIVELLDAYSTYVDARRRSIDLRGAALRGNQQLDRVVGPTASRDVPTL